MSQGEKTNKQLRMGSEDGCFVEKDTMDSSSNIPNMENPKQAIQTLIFFDVESTGLPFTVGKKNVQITELSLIAVDRTEFENSKNIRVVNKLNLTIQPRSNIPLDVIHMTGLCNTSLQFQEHFSPTTAQLLQLFFQRLNHPVCLLAHNGRRFDFPLLQAELRNVGATLGDSVYCADTIDAFRGILSKQNSVEMNSPVTNTCSTDITYCQPETLHDADHVNRNMKSNMFAIDAAKSCEQYYNVETLKDEQIEELLCQEMEIFENFKSQNEFRSFSIDVGKNDASSTADDLLYPLTSQHNEKTPLNKVTNVSVVSSRCKIPEAVPITPDSKNKNHSSVKRKLFRNEDLVSGSQTLTTKTVKNKNKMSFSLQNLYHYFFNSAMPLAHFAEADCLSLMKISRELKDFLPWIDDHMILFNNVKPLW